jgi:hypothetical protein
MTTPLGDIEICIDGKTIKYTAQNSTDPWESGI